jgi:hypothetical protein
MVLEATDINVAEGAWGAFQLFETPTEEGQ